MGAKFSKIASIKSATEVSVAFKKLLKLMRKIHKDYEPHMNHNTALQRAYNMSMVVIDVFRLQHAFYPLELADFTLVVDDYYELKQDVAIYAINCMNPLLKRLPKLNMEYATQLVVTMRRHVRAYMCDELGMRFVTLED